MNSRCFFTHINSFQHCYCHSDYNAEHLRSHIILLLCSSHGRCALSDCTSCITENTNKLKLFSVWLRFIFLRSFKKLFSVGSVSSYETGYFFSNIRQDYKNSIRNSTSRNSYLLLVICAKGTKCLDLLRDSGLLPWQQEQWNNSSSSAGLCSFTRWAMNAMVIGVFLNLC